MGLFDLFKGKSNKCDQEDPVSILNQKIAEKLQKAGMFWAEYTKEKDYFLRLDLREAVAQTNVLLKKHMPGVYAEYQKEDEDGSYQLILSADGILKHFRDVMLLTQNAPTFDGLSIEAFRQRSQSKIFSIGMGDFSLSTEEILVKMAPKQGRIKIEIAWSKPVEQEMQDHAKQMTIIMMDHIIGEYDSVVRIIQIDFAKEPLTQEHGEDWVPLCELAFVFDAMWKDTLGHTQVFPSGEGQWSSFKITSQEQEEDVDFVTLNDSAMAIACRADMGVRLDVTVKVPDKDVLNRAYDYSDMLDARLYPRQLGINVLSILNMQSQLRIMTWYVFDEHPALVAATEVAKQFPDLEMTFTTEYDPRWESYLAWAAQ